MISSLPKVSVVMPVKECNPEFLEKSVSSILNQTLTDLELIIVLDHDMRPIDFVQDIFEEYRDDKRIRVIENRTKGFVEALNFGLLASRGEYIARLDSDDISLPDRFKTQIQAVKKLNLDLVGGWAYVIDENGFSIGELTPPTNPVAIRRLIMLHNPFLHSTMLFKKSILKRSGPYNISLYGAEDYDLWLRIISLGYRFANIPNYVIKLRETSDSVMRGQQWKKTRINYARVKALGITRLGYHDPLSLSFSFAAPT